MIGVLSKLRIENWRKSARFGERAEVAHSMQQIISSGPDIKSRSLEKAIMKSPNKLDAASPVIASRLHAGRHGRGVGDPGRSA